MMKAPISINYKRMSNMPNAMRNEKKLGFSNQTGQMVQAQVVHGNVWDRLVGITTLREEDAGTKT